MSNASRYDGRGAEPPYPTDRDGLTAEIERLTAYAEGLERDARELWKALANLSFHCDGVISTCPPPRTVYNEAFYVMDRLKATYGPDTKQRGHVQGSQEVNGVGNDSRLEPPHCSCGAYPGGLCDDANWERCKTKADSLLKSFPQPDVAAYLLKTYRRLYDEAKAENAPFVQVSTGNFPHFLAALECPQTGNDSAGQRMKGFLAGWQKGRAPAGNYVANAEVNPTRVLFENGRTVEIVDGHLVVGWARDEAVETFHGEETLPLGTQPKEPT